MTPTRAVRTIVLAALFSAAPALGQTRDPATAEALFQAGRKAFDSGHYAEACAKFADSQRLDPGAGTLINLAACREKINQLSLAWEAWQEALRTLSSDDNRRPEVARRAKALEARLPHLVVELAPDAPHDSHVTRDGTELGGPALGLAIPVDPGKHVIDVTAPGHAAKHFEIDVQESKTARITVAPGDAVAQAPTAPPPRAVAPKPPPAKPSEPARPEHDRGAPHGNKTLGFVIGGIGAAGIVVGGVTGFLALGKKHTMDDECSAKNGTEFCSPAGLDAAHSGKTLATVSTVSFAAGAVALGVGAYFVFSSNGESTTALSTHALPGGGSLGIARTF